MLIGFQFLCMQLTKKKRQPKDLAWGQPGQQSKTRIMISTQDNFRNQRPVSRCLRTNRPTEFHRLLTFSRSKFKVSLSKDVFHFCKYRIHLLFIRDNHEVTMHVSSPYKHSKSYRLSTGFVNSYFSVLLLSFTFRHE